MDRLVTAFDFSLKKAKEVRAQQKPAQVVAKL
jgi:hypothetical protein